MNPQVVMLAAGRSTRVGVPKGLIAVMGRAWIEHQLDALEGAGLAGVVVVLAPIAAGTSRPSRSSAVAPS